MHCSMSKLAVLAALLLLGGVSSFFAEARHGNSTVVRGPTCSGWSDNKLYGKNVASLIDKLVDKTKNVHRKPHEDYKYVRSFPAKCHAGTGATGGATCNKELAGMDCWGCLVVAKYKFRAPGCNDHPVSGHVQLKDCSMWFTKYH